MPKQPAIPGHSSGWLAEVRFWQLQLSSLPFNTYHSGGSG